MREECPYPIHAGSEGYKEKTASEREVLEKVPKQLACPALTSHEKIAGFPKLLPQEGCRPAIASEHEGCETVRHASDDAEGHYNFDKKAETDKPSCDAGGRYDFACLLHGAGEIDNLVERAEGKEQHDQQATHSESDHKAESRHGARNPARK